MIHEVSIKINAQLTKIIIFDGVCLLCNTAVYFLHKRLRYQNYKFVPSQSELGEEYINKYDLSKITNETIVLVRGADIFTKSDAMFEIINDMPMIWSSLKIFKFVPRKIRNRLYDLISRYRYLLFGNTK